MDSIVGVPGVSFNIYGNDAINVGRRGESLEIPVRRHDHRLLGSGLKNAGIFSYLQRF